MGLIVPIETESGYAVEIAPRPEDVPTVRAKERAHATARCLALADTIAATDPQRAQRLRTVANDPQRTTAERWGAYKNDDRQPREQAEPTGETRIR